MTGNHGKAHLNVILCMRVCKLMNVIGTGVDNNYTYIHQCIYIVIASLG